MLAETKREHFWSRISLYPLMKQHGDVNQYLDNTNIPVGYINTFTRRYFLVLKHEEKDLLDVQKADLVLQNNDPDFAPKPKKVKPTVNLAEKYPHALVDTLTKDPELKKSKVRIKCVVCGDTSRWVYTSDLFQVKMCKKCSDEVKEVVKAKRIQAVEE